MGLRLEAAMLAMSLKSMRLMPTGTALALNVSPALILEGRTLKRLLGPIRQAVTLEVTEHRQIVDYEARPPGPAGPSGQRRTRDRRCRSGFR